MPDAVPLLEGDAAAAVRHRGSHVQIIAAGSGKTEVVSQRVADLLVEGVPARSVVAFTFTERAATELPSRRRVRPHRVAGTTRLGVDGLISAYLRLLGATHADGTGGPSPASGPNRDGPQHVVVDLGRLDELAEHQCLETNGVAGTHRWLVVRGSRYLSLRAAIDHPWRPHGIVVLAEAGRPLTSADVSDVVGAPVIAQVPVEAAVARIIDAGLLLARLPRLSAFQSLARLLPAQPRPENAPAA